MRHTSGLTYGFTGVWPVQKLIKAADVRPIDRTTAENVEAIAALPLMHQPGAAWEYGVSTDVLGRDRRDRRGGAARRRPARASLRPARHDRHRLLHPGGEAPAARRAVLVRLHDGRGRRSRNPTSPPKFESGGGGLLSTLADYTRFTAMLSDGGALDGVRIMSPRTVAYMATDHLDATVNRDHYLLWPGHGFGLGFAVRTEPGRRRRSAASANISGAA